MAQFGGAVLGFGGADFVFGHGVKTLRTAPYPAFPHFLRAKWGKERLTLNMDSLTITVTNPSPKSGLDLGEVREGAAHPTVNHHMPLEYFHLAVEAFIICSAIASKFLNSCSQTLTPRQPVKVE